MDNQVVSIFTTFTIVNNAAMNTREYISSQITVYIFFGYMLSSGIAGSYDSFVFSYFEETSLCFPRWLHQFTATNSILGFTFPTSFPAHLLFFDFWMTAILTGVRQHLMVVSIGTSLMMSIFSWVCCQRLIF